MIVDTSDNSRTGPRSFRAPIYRRLLGKAIRLRDDRGGSAAILFALAMPMLIGALGLGFEVSNWYMVERGMQNAADAAALAAATNRGTNYNIEAKAVANKYGFSSGVTVANNVACPGGGGNVCYRATITKSVPLYLSPVVGYAGSGGGQQNLSATAIANPFRPRKYCILALGTTGVVGITANGAPKANLDGCNIKSNTNATCNGSDLGADHADAVGVNSGCGDVQTSGVTVSADPYASLASHIPPDTCAGTYAGTLWNTAKTWSGNKEICGTLKLTADVTVNSAEGVLVIQNGQLDTNGYTIKTSSGSGLTVVFSGSVGGAYLHTPKGGGTIDIAAPTTGDWKGIAMYQDPKLTSGVDMSDAGNSPTWNITGLVYLPHSDVTFSGAVNKSSNGNSCFVMVVDTLRVNGTGGILSNGGCLDAGLSMPTGDAAQAKLVF